jgi:uncharacterized membrane protein
MSESDFPLPPYPPAPEVQPLDLVAPMTFGQILERIFRLTRSHFRPFAVIGMAPFAVLLIFYAVFFGALGLAGVFQHPPARPDVTPMMWILFPMTLLFIPVMFVIYGLYYGASSFAALQADHGMNVTVGEAFRHAWSRLGSYVWLMVLRSLIVAIPIFVCAFVIGIGAALLGLAVNRNASPVALFFLIPLGILFYLCAIIYAIIMSLRLSLAFPACVHEGLTATQAIKRSGVLTRGAKGRIFLVLLLI